MKIYLFSFFIACRVKFVLDSKLPVLQLNGGIFYGILGVEIFKEFIQLDKETMLSSGSIFSSIYSIIKNYPAATPTQ